MKTVCNTASVTVQLPVTLLHFLPCLDFFGSAGSSTHRKMQPYPTVRRTSLPGYSQHPTGMAGGQDGRGGNNWPGFKLIHPGILVD